MSSVIQGAKSKLYLNKDEIPGYTAIQSNDSLQHITVQEIEGQRAAMDVVIHGKYPIVPSIAIAAGSAKRVIKLTGHGLVIGKKGYCLKPLNGNAAGEEVAILSVVDANTVIIAAEIDMAVGNLVELYRHITPNYTEDGDLNVVVTAAGPTQYSRVSGGITTTTTVTENLDTPSLSRALPVVIHGLDAASITVTGDQLNISSSHANDSMRLGDGTTLTGVTLAGELKTKDADLLAQSILLVAKDFATQATLAQVKAKTDNIPALGQALAAASVPVVLTAAQEAALTPPAAITGFATSANQDSERVLLGAVSETAPISDTASSGLNGRLQRIAQNISSLILQIPASLGIKTAANSLSIAPASDAVFATTSTPQSTSGAITSTQATVGTSAVRATVAGTAPSASRKKLIIKPSKSNSGAIYYGGSGVTTANGLEIIGVDTREFTLDASDYYLISDTAAQVVEIIEVV